MDTSNFAPHYQRIVVEDEIALYVRNIITLLIKQKSKVRDTHFFLFQMIKLINCNWSNMYVYRL